MEASATMRHKPKQRLLWLVASSMVTVVLPALLVAESPAENRAPLLLEAPANRPAVVIDANRPAATGPIVAEPAPPTTGSLPESFTPSDEFQAWVTSLVREHLPDQYEKTKNWGHTTKVWDGLKITTNDGRISTKRRWKEANDGTWYKYRVDLVEPEKHFDIQVQNIREIGGGKIAADIDVVAKLKCFGRMSQWEHGVQLISLSADVDTKVRLRAQLELGMRLDASRFPPDVVFAPEVTRARLDIVDFRLRRVSNAKGPVVKSLSSSVRELVEDKLEEQNRGKLAEKLNTQIAKQQDKLRIGLPEVARSPWSSLVTRQTAAAAE